MCMERLGPEAFSKVYALIKAHSLSVSQPQPAGGAAGGYGGDTGAADDEALQRAVEGLLGPALLAYWPLVDQLIFCEELNELK